MVRLVDDLLDATRISRGKIQLARTRLDLRDAIRRSCEDHRSLLESHHIELHLELPSTPTWVDADATRVLQAVGNLLSNAAKFTPAGGHVVVEVSTRDDWARVAVRDTGAGIEAADMDRMFEPFVQGDQGLARTAGGLGLGLALVKGLVELHGGHVTASSDGPGRGCEFVISLPLAGAPTGAPGPAGPAVAGARRRVLIIEDNRDAAVTLADTLRLAGHEVQLAHDGRTGVTAARDLRPDFVLCDVGLPDMSGLEVARLLRDDETLRSTRLVALTGYALPSDRQRALDAGFGAHLAKPVQLEELFALLASGEGPGA
jgi:CheY-like chemotaxis protein